MRRHKFKATRTVVDGMSFPSKLEASVYSLLKLREHAGEIGGLERPGGVDLVLSPLGPIRYKPDFVFSENGVVTYVEAKGAMTDRWRLIRKLWAAFGPGPLEVWKGTYLKPFIQEVIRP